LSDYVEPAGMLQYRDYALSIQRVVIDHRNPNFIGHYATLPLDQGGCSGLDLDLVVGGSPAQSIHAAYHTTHLGRAPYTGNDALKTAYRKRFVHLRVTLCPGGTGPA
jgi:hypothetical protein